MYVDNEQKQSIQNLYRICITDNKLAKDKYYRKLRIEIYRVKSLMKNSHCGVDQLSDLINLDLF